MQLVINISATYGYVGEILSTNYVQEKRKKQQAVFVKDFIKCVFLARQGLAFRGDGTNKVNSNFVKLLKLRGLDDPSTDDWISKKTNKYTSHNIQGKVLKAMALTLLQKIAAI